MHNYTLTILRIVTLLLRHLSVLPWWDHVPSVCPFHASLQMHQLPSVPTHHKGLSSLADVTRPDSVIERDANPAPIQSLAVGGVGQKGILRETWGMKLETGDKAKHVGYRLVERHISDPDRWDRCCTRWERIPGTTRYSTTWSFPGIPQILFSPHPDFALEAKSLSEGSAEGECCGSCSAPPAPPLVSSVHTEEEPGFTTVVLEQDDEDICLSPNEG